MSTVSPLNEEQEQKLAEMKQLTLEFLKRLQKSAAERSRQINFASEQTFEEEPEPDNSTELKY